MISTISDMIDVAPYPKSDDALGAHRYMYLSIMGYHTHETKPDLITSSLRIKHFSWNLILKAQKNLGYKFLRFKEEL